MGIQNPQFWTGSPFAYGLCSSSFQTSNATLETRMHFVFCTFYPSKNDLHLWGTLEILTNLRRKRTNVRNNTDYWARCLHSPCMAKEGYRAFFLRANKHKHCARVNTRLEREINKSKHDRPRTVVERTERMRRRKKGTQRLSPDRRLHVVVHVVCACVHCYPISHPTFGPKSLTQKNPSANSTEKGTEIES